MLFVKNALFKSKSFGQWDSFGQSRNAAVVIGWLVRFRCLALFHFVCWLDQVESLRFLEEKNVECKVDGRNKNIYVKNKQLTIVRLTTISGWRKNVNIETRKTKNEVTLMTMIANKTWLKQLKLNHRNLKKNLLRITLLQKLFNWQR